MSKLAVIICLVLLAAFPALAIEKGVQQPPETARLKPDQYTWNPDASPEGVVGIIVDLKRQMLHVYRGGKQIARAAVSTGIKSHPTAPGTYTILTKNIKYHSEKYHEASMPFMERLTWDGMAIHGGNNPGRPSSHGCIHVPLDFAEKLYGITQEGDTVLISDLPEAPEDTVNPDLLPHRAPEPAPDPKSPFKVRAAARRRRMSPRRQRRPRARRQRPAHRTPRKRVDGSVGPTSARLVIGRG